jgi:hypothetical protein
VSATDLGMKAADVAKAVTQIRGYTLELVPTVFVSVRAEVRKWQAYLLWTMCCSLNDDTVNDAELIEIINQLLGIKVVAIQLWPACVEAGDADWREARLFTR